jgi:hypothetical protein
MTTAHADPSRHREFRLGTATLLLCCVAAACSSTSSPAASGGSGGASATGVAGTAGADGHAGSASGGTAGTSDGGGAGRDGVAGSSGFAGSGGEMPTTADATAAIHTACVTASQACPQLDITKCEAQSAAALPPQTARCFPERVAFLECAAKLPASEFQCMGDETSFNQQACPNENAAVQACYAVDAGP